MFCMLTAVDYNEKTQEIDAHGDVRIEPYRSRTQNTIIPAKPLCPSHGNAPYS